MVATCKCSCLYPTKSCEFLCLIEPSEKKHVHCSFCFVFSNPQGFKKKRRQQQNIANPTQPNPPLS